MYLLQVKGEPWMYILRDILQFETSLDGISTIDNVVLLLYIYIDTILFLIYTEMSFSSIMLQTLNELIK